MSNHTVATPTKKRKTHPFYDGGQPTWEIAYLFPAQGYWTVRDYFDLEAQREGAHPLLELSNGRLEVLSMPTQSHQMIVYFLLKVLEAFVTVHAPGLVSFSGLKTRLWNKKFREPDVLYMCAANLNRCREKYWEGADLVMEVVSPDPKDRKRDLEIKPREYARAGIPEYWIIDPEKHYIRVLVLDGTTYKLHGEFGPGQFASSVLLPGFTVAVDAALHPPGT